MLKILAAVASPWKQAAVLDDEWDVQDEQDEQGRNQDSTRTHALLCITDACMTMSICGATEVNLRDGRDVLFSHELTTS